jgi:protein O-GlcNAc transferase
VLNSLLKALRGQKPNGPQSANAGSGDDLSREQLLALAVSKYEEGEPEAAERLAREVLAGSPEHAVALSVLAATAADRGEFPLACAIYDRILASRNNDPEWLSMGADVNRRAGCLTRALELAGRSIDLDPVSVKAWVAQSNALEAAGRLQEAHRALSRAVALDPGNSELHSRLLFMLTQNALASPRETLDEHRAWSRRHADALCAAAIPYGNDPDPARRLRVGYVSGDFKRHSVSYFIEPVLAAHRREDFEVFCYSNCRRPDERTQRLRALADSWRDISQLDDEQAAHCVRHDAIDILVDLSGHTIDNRLLMFARRPAPLQLTWLGYLGTTGMAAINYCLSDPVCDPPGTAESHYAEKVLRLPATQWCYQAPADCPAVTPLPALRRGYPTFGSFAAYARLNSETFRSWAAILSALPQARLRLVGLPSGEALDRMFESFESAGVSVDRLDVVGWLAFDSYLAQYSEVDICLAPYPYNGATTICEALWMGLPVVCRSGETRAARSGASLLAALGLEELLAATQEDYIDIAIRLAGDTSLLAALRTGLRERMRRSAVSDAHTFTPALEKLYREIWSEWCQPAGENCA